MTRGGLLVTGDGFSVTDVHCHEARSGFGPAEVTRHHVLAIVRRGAFIRRADGQETLLDPTAGYLAAPGTESQFAHPAPGGDRCTAIRLAPALLAALAGGDPEIAIAAVPVDAAAELALRRVVALARGPGRADPGGALAEQVTRVVAGLLARRRPDRVASGRPATAAAHRRLASQARLALAADPAVGLIELSRLVGCSPYHLSRVFAAEAGSSFSRYRARLRVSLALQRLADGDRDLAGLAADLGFADHAHLTRTIRAHTGATPSRCRALLSGVR